MPLRALALSPRPFPSLRLLRAEGRVRALLTELLELEAQREEVESALAAFSAGWQRDAGAALAELDDAERLVRRLRRLDDELQRLIQIHGKSAARERDERSLPAAVAARQRPVTPPSTHRAGGRVATPAGRGAAPGLDIVLVEPEEVALKRLHRRLARAVHPDLARGDAERALFEDWMARVNSAYHRRDLAALEVLADKIGLGAAPGDPTECERLARLERRAIALSAARDTAARDLARLRASGIFRWRRDAQQRAEAGGDLATETRAAAAERVASLRADALERYDSTISRASELESVLRSRSGGRRNRAAIDPIAGCALARRALPLSEVSRPGARGLDLARELEELARHPAPWEAALTLIAFYAEVGGRVPEGLATAKGLRQRWDALRAGWPSAPDLPRALARLPRHLDVGLRVRGVSVAAGLQLSSAETLAGVRHALASGALRLLAREVLAACGPRERCDSCDAVVSAVHLLRTRGLDEVHGVACPRCGSVLRSYWRYGDSEGLEALAPLALEVGLLAEAHVRMGRRTVAFQMLPARRAALTAERLARLVHGLYVQPNGLPLKVNHIAFQADGAPGALAPGDVVAEGAPVKLRLSGAAVREREVMSWVKERIEERFRQ